MNQILSTLSHLSVQDFSAIVGSITAVVTIFQRNDFHISIHHSPHPSDMKTLQPTIKAPAPMPVMRNARQITPFAVLLKAFPYLVIALCLAILLRTYFTSAAAIITSNAASTHI